MADAKLSAQLLNINGLHTAIKRKKLTEWIRTHDLTTETIQETHIKFKVYIG